jgi:hypothetical protein
MKGRALFSVAVCAAVLFLISSMPAYADITGSFETHFQFNPQSTASEISLIDFDIQNALNITAVISGLSITFHTHFGIAGVEDVIVTTKATLGALDISSDIVFGRFLGSCFPFSIFFNSCFSDRNIFNEIFPVSDSLLFVKKRVGVSINIGGIKLDNLYIFEDVNFRSGDPLAGQSQQFAFGDVITISGATPSGIALNLQAGICAERNANVIKKHFWPYRVNEVCATEPKPDLLFDFETINIEGVPIAPNVIGGGLISCITFLGCDLFVDLAINGGPVPFSTILTFTNLTALEFGGAQLIFQSGIATMTLGISSTGTLSFIEVNVNATLNPDTNPATLSINAAAAPGVGLVDANIQLMIQRANLALTITASFGGGPPATFDGVTFGLRVPGSLVSLESTATFDSAGMDRADIWITVTF